MEIVVEFFLHMVAKEWNLVVFIRIQWKPMKRMHAKVYDRTGQPVVYRTLAKTSDERLSRIYFIVLYFVTIGSFTADGGLLQPTVGVKTTPQKTRFRSVRIYTICKEFTYSWKVNMWEQLTTSEVMTRMQSDKHTNMFNVVANLKHVNTHETNNWRLVSARSLFVCSVSSELLVLSSSVAQFLAHMIDHTVAQVCALFVSSSSPCLVRTLSDSLSDLSIYLTFLLFILLFFLHILLPFTFLLMSWTTTTRTAAEELAPQDYKNSSTGYEPNEYHITEAYVEYTRSPRASSPSQWLRLRWRHHRQDAPWCVPKTSRSLWRRPVVLSVVVSQSWEHGETRCLPTCVERPRNSETQLWECTD